jgi:integrase/recombinase XerC
VAPKASTSPSDLVVRPGVTQTTDDLVSRHLQHLRLRGLAASYMAERRRYLAAVATHLDRPLLDVTCDDLQRWQDQALARRKPGRSRNVAITHVREFYRWAHQHDLTGDDRGRHLLRAKQARLVPRPVAEDVLRDALVHAPDRLRPMLYLAAFEGLRACEIAGLRREDVRDRDDPAVLVVLGKGRKERILPLSPQVLDELRKHGMPRRGPVFTGLAPSGLSTGRPLTATRVSGLCNQHLHAIGAEVTLHQLRHRFASQALRHAGGDLRLVQELLGHASPATTAIYTQWATDRAAGVVEALCLQDARILPLPRREESA